MASGVTRQQLMSNGLHQCRQSGAMTLAISLAILVLSTLLTFSMSRVILMEQKISNNEFRSRQAFEAAEAGVTAALAYFGDGADRDNDGVIDPVFDTDADGIGDSDTARTGTATMAVASTDLGDMKSIAITSRGYSDDNSAMRVIRLATLTIPPVPNLPQNPLTTKGSVIISGSATVHNPQGFGTIWSGKDVALGSNNATSTYIPDFGQRSFPACMEFALACSLAGSSNRLIIGTDVIANDSSLGALTTSEFFRNFFGLPPTAYRSSMVTLETTATNLASDAHLATRKVIWVEGDTVLNGITVGCSREMGGSNICPDNDTVPSILIINGDASFSGNSQIYGILFVVGNAVAGGNATVHGAMMVGGDLTDSPGSSIALWYRSDVLQDTAKAGRIVGASGTWTDF